MNNELYHHGILGQHWGKRNGPPYPLDARDHSAEEKRKNNFKINFKADPEKRARKEYRKTEKKIERASLKQREKADKKIAKKYGYEVLSNSREKEIERAQKLENIKTGVAVTAAVLPIIGSLYVSTVMSQMSAGDYAKIAKKVGTVYLKGTGKVFEAGVKVGARAFL